jgi:uncharacterized membrane protein
MSFGDISGTGWLMLAAGWVHAIAATAWVGGSIFFALVLRPVTAANPELGRAITGPIGGVYRELVDASVIALLVSGIIIMFNRLTGNDAGPVYFAVLGIKVALALWMFYVVWRLRRSGWRPAPGNGMSSRLSWLLGYNAVMVTGVVIYLLAGLLAQLYETAIAK